MKTREPHFVKLTLDWCNRQRAKKGKRPLKRLPKGYMDNVTSCPCGAATGLAVYLDTFSDVDKDHPYGGASKDRKLPKSVQTFVIEFDSGYLPQYTVGGIKAIEEFFGEGYCDDRF